MELLSKEDINIQVMAQLHGYKVFERQPEEYRSMTKKKLAENAEKVRALADRLYEKYTGWNFPEEISVRLRKRSRKELKNAGGCFCKKDSEGNLIVHELIIDEEVFFHRKDLIRFLKQELARIYEIERTGRNIHGERLGRLLEDKFNMKSDGEPVEVKCLKDRIQYNMNLEILASLKESYTEERQP